MRTHTGGMLAAKDPTLCDQIYFIQNAEGGALGPFDCWLCLRGLKTMSLRMERQAANCKRMAEWLAAHPLVSKVNYAGMPGTPDAALHWQQATGEGSLLSFTTDDIDVSKTVVTETKLFKITVSFGNVTSLISLPCYMSHASIPAEVRQTERKALSAPQPPHLVRMCTHLSTHVGVSLLPLRLCFLFAHLKPPPPRRAREQVRAARGLPDDLVRISAGIEDVDDLIADLQQAFVRPHILPSSARLISSAVSGVERRSSTTSQRMLPPLTEGDCQRRTRRRRRRARRRCPRVLRRGRLSW